MAKGKNKPRRRRRAFEVAVNGGGINHAEAKRSTRAEPRKFTRSASKLTGRSASETWKSEALRSKPVLFIKASADTNFDEALPTSTKKTPNSNLEPKNARKNQNGATRPQTEPQTEPQFEPVASQQTNDAVFAANMVNEEIMDAGVTRICEKERSETRDVPVASFDTIERPVAQADYREDASSFTNIDREDALEGVKEEVYCSDAENFEFPPHSPQDVLYSSASETDSELFSEEDDIEDMMTELDDEQIFALARMAPNGPDAYDDDILDMDAAYDDDNSLDDILTELLGDGVTDLSKWGHDSLPEPKVKRPLSKRQRARLEERDKSRANNYYRNPPLWEKYPSSMSVDDVEIELAALAKHGKIGAVISFPPLGGTANRYIKDLSSRNGFTAKIKGAGTYKYVEVARANRTNYKRFRGKIHQLASGHENFGRTDVRVSLKKSGAERRSTRIHDGHVVGGGSSEIPSDNFGHQLLLKMGWEQGAGLGHAKNGITAPVSATVKLSKRGLGQ